MEILSFRPIRLYLSEDDKTEIDIVISKLEATMGRLHPDDKPSYMQNGIYSFSFVPTAVFVILIENVKSQDLKWRLQDILEKNL